MRLRSHLTRLRIDASSVGSSPNELRKGAKNYCRGLFKIAQVVLRNRAGGSGACLFNGTFLPMTMLIPPKCFDIFPPITGGCSEGLGVL